MGALPNADFLPKETLNPPTILTVEDDEGLRLLIQRIFRREGFYSHGVSKGSEAIEWLTSHDCALLLLDYRLPDMTGEEVIGALKERGLDIPFIVCTGLGDENAAKDMLRLGARDYMVKERAFFVRLRRAVAAALGQLPAMRKPADDASSLRNPS